MTDLIEQLREEISTYKGGARHTRRYKLMKYAADELERLNKIIADAPHDEGCLYLMDVSDAKCDCFKAKTGEQE